MRSRRNHKASRVLGPQVLAVLSCTLALLAAQPVIDGARAHAKAAVPALKTQAPLSASIPSAAALHTTAAVKAPVARRGEPASFSTRPLRILATVEILQRLLAHQLAPLHQPAAPLFIFEPVCELTFTPPALAPHAYHPGGALDPPQPVEQRFALTHLLLAPPIA